jgi:hypothetical protein
VTLVEFQGRRETREPVEMMARFRHGISTVTVMLKDITPHGARVEGVGPLAADDAVFLMLPGLAPKLAFVAWSSGQSAGLEFAEPLDQQVFSGLVADFGRSFESLTRVA